MPLTDDHKAEIAEARSRTRETCRATVPALEARLYDAIPVLDHGFVRVIDYMGDDAAIVQAVRHGGSGVTQAAFDMDPWAWYDVTSFQLVILNLNDLSLTPVSLPPAAAMSSIPLSMDGRTFVQVYPNGSDAGAHLYEVKTDGSVMKIVEAGSGSDFSMIGRVR
jgi:hypothetical protein